MAEAERALREVANGDGAVLIGATVLCGLVLLALIADRFGSRLWQGAGERTFYRCESCDLRYVRRELNDPRMQVCPQGHSIYEEPRSATAGLVAIFVCIGFLSTALLLAFSGVVPPGP